MVHLVSIERFHMIVSHENNPVRVCYLSKIDMAVASEQVPSTVDTHVAALMREPVEILIRAGRVDRKLLDIEAAYAKHYWPSTQCRAPLGSHLRAAEVRPMSIATPRSGPDVEKSIVALQRAMLVL